MVTFEFSFSERNLVKTVEHKVRLLLERRYGEEIIEDQAADFIMKKANGKNYV